MKNLQYLVLAMLVLSSCAKKEGIKIGFIVKQPEVSWFQDEWRFADQAGIEKGFEVIKLGGEDGEKLLASLDSIAIQGAKGVIVVAPDIKLGTAIVAKAKANGLKLMTVDDRLINSQGNPIESVPHMGISAYNIGLTLGDAIVEEAKSRNWDLKDPSLGIIRVTFESTPTIMERINGVTVQLKEAGAVNFIDARSKALTIADAFDAVNIALTQNSHITKWIVYGGNDETAIGGVRAIEERGFTATSIIGGGINGDENAISEFKKTNPTGFTLSVLLSAKRHGYETALNMYDWIVNDTTPEPVIWTSGNIIHRDNYKEVMTDLGL